jgi:hypothetical protein
MPLSLDAEDDAPRSVGKGTVGELTIGAVPPGDDVTTDPGLESGTACGDNMGDDVKSCIGTSVVGLDVIAACGANVGVAVNSSTGAGVTTILVSVVGLLVIKTDLVTVGESVGTRDAVDGVATVTGGIAAAPPT